MVKRDPDKITTVPVRAAGCAAAEALSMFIHNIFFLLITIQVIERISASTPQHTNTSVCVSVQIHHLLLEKNQPLEIGVNGVEYNTS